MANPIDTKVISKLAEILDKNHPDTFYEQVVTSNARAVMEKGNI